MLGLFLECSAAVQLSANNYFQADEEFLKVLTFAVYKNRGQRLNQTYLTLCRQCRDQIIRDLLI